MSSGGGGSTTTVQKSDPWVGQQPYLKAGFQNASNWYNNGGTQVAPLNDIQNSAISGVTDYANSNANGLQSNLNGTLNNFLNGSFLNSNPYLSQMADAMDNSVVRNYQNAVAPGISSNAELAGRYGSGAMTNQQSQSQQDLATQLGNINANLYGNAYQSGLNNMVQAASLSPTAVNSGLNLLNAKNAAGSQIQQQQQSVNNQPITNLQNYQALINGNYGGTASTSTPYYQNGTANALGGALGGAMLGNSLFATGGALAGLGMSQGAGEGLGALAGLLLA